MTVATAGAGRRHAGRPLSRTAVCVGLLMVGSLASAQAVLPPPPVFELGVPH